MKSSLKKYPIIMSAFSLLLLLGATAWAQTITQTFNHSGSLQSFTVPAGVTSVTISAKGAEGGRANAGGAIGGLGGSATGTFTVIPGSQLQIVVGGRGADGAGSDGYWSSAGGGGGGSFVAVGAGFANFSSPLIAAGGGGGGFAGSFSGGHVRTNGGSGGASTGGSGAGGNSTSGYGGGGGGIIGSGAVGGSCMPTSNGGKAINTGAAGGANGNCLGTINNISGKGGFGGGGGANWGSGGGGGYTGGNANVYTGTPAQGGSSYTQSGATGVAYLSGVHSGNGVVTITYLGLGQTLNFDGVDDHVNLGMSITNTLDPINTLTVEAWVYPTSNSGLGCIVGNYNTNIWDGQLQFLLRRDNTTYGVYINNGSYFIGLNTAANSVALNTWQHIAATWDGSQVKIYLNGVLANTANHAGSSFPASAHEVWIGGNQMNNTENFRGNIDEVRIWTRALCQGELQNNMNCEAPATSGLIANYHFKHGVAFGNNAGVTTLADASGNAINGTLNNFALNGSVSNWINPGANVSGNCNYYSCCTAPAIVCPENITVNTEPGRCGATVNFAATATGTTPVITYSHNPGSFFPVGTTVVTATANNSCGTASCTFTVRVRDNQAPDAVCKNITVQLDANGNASITAADVDGGSSDNCGIASVTIDNSSFTCANVGANTVTLMVTDVNGNVSTCNATVTVEDKVAPVAICQNITRHVDSNGQVAFTAADVDGGSSDACGIASISVDKTSFDCSNLGVNTVTLTVTDVNGNVSTCTATVTITDEVVDYAACKNVTVSLDANGQATISAAQVDNGSFDACGIVSMTLDKTSFDCSNVGVNAIVMTVTDVHGNTSTCQGEVTVVDNVAPSAVCKNITVQLDASGNASITAADVDAGSTDNCGIASIAIDNASFTCASVGANTVTLTVTDMNGNVSTCTVTVTVEDNIAPAAICKNITRHVDSNGQVIFSAADVDGGSTDACGIASISVDKTSFDCSNIGLNTVTLTVTDVNGNASTCTATVTITDEVVDYVACKNVTLYLDANGQATLSVAQVDDGSFDACGIVSMTLDKTSFDCSNVGVNAIVMIATDANGNTSTCQGEVTVVDNIAPSITCPQNINITPSRENCNPAVYWESAVAGDNCSASLSSTHNPGDAFPVGTTTVTYTATDPSGNTTSCSFTVTVTPEPLTGNVSAKTYAGGYNVSCFGAADGEAAVSVEGGCLPYQYSWNTSPVQTGTMATGLAAGAYDVLVTDANGTSITVSVTLTEPTLLVASAGSNQTVYFGYNTQSGCATLNATAGGGVAPYAYAWSDGSTASSITVCPSASQVYTVTVKDANGCVSVSTVKVCVIDVRCEKGGNAIVYYTGGKVLVCHVPDGDQSKKFTICIAPSAVPDHLAHGDVLGVCGTSTECISAGKTEKEVVQTSLVTEENIGLTSYPNPFANETTVRFYSTQAGTIEVSIYNLLGEKAATLFNGAVLANEVHEEKLKANSLANGTYFVKVITEQGFVKVERVILSR